LIVDKNFVEMVALFALATTAVGRWGGLDFFVYHGVGKPMLERVRRRRRSPFPVGEPPSAESLAKPAGQVAASSGPEPIVTATVVEEPEEPPAKPETPRDDKNAPDS
jgi:hypothetical protein